jgi:hypothetical protein
MIRIDIDLAIASLICLELSSILISICREDKKMLFPQTLKAKIVKCEICSYVYFAPHQIVFSKCPLCLSVNKVT